MKKTLKKKVKPDHTFQDQHIEIKLSKVRDPQKLFDLLNTADLPFSITNRASINTVNHKVCELLELKNKLTCTELRVGFFRLYGEKLKDGALGGALAALINHKLVRRAGYALYERTDKSSIFPRLTK